MESPAESTRKADANTRKLRPEVEHFLERVVVPALVNRYIKELKEGKNRSQRAQQRAQNT